MKHIFSGFFSNLKEVFSGYSLVWHALAILLTFLIVRSGLDWAYFKTASQYLNSDYFFPAIFMGSILPFLVPILLYVLGKIERKRETVEMAFAVAQAAFLGSLISSLYKSLTGRIPPEMIRTTEDLLSAVDVSHGFRFGFMEGGIFWGWPSSHTTIAFAMAVTLTLILARKSKWAYGILFYALYVGIAISFTIHWLSEFVAGAVIGTLIGAVVARNYQKKLSL